MATAGGVVPVMADSRDLQIVDFAFDPAELTVFTGEPVTWTNASTRGHTVTSDDGAELDGNPIGAGESYGHVFEAPGIYAYHCEIHPRMTGVITVKAAPATPAVSGSVEPTPPTGTLPPDFSPFPSVGPDATPSPTRVDSASPAPSPAPVGSGGGGLETTVAVLLGLVAIGALGWGLWRRGRAT